MKKRTKILMVIILIIAVLCAGWYIYEQQMKAKIQILDGPGSYMEWVSGTVTEVAEVTEYGYTVTLQMDREFAEHWGAECCTARVELSGDEDDAPYPVGTYIALRFAGGYDYSGDPLELGVVYDAIPVEELEQE